MIGDPGRIGSRLFDACLMVLLAAMALYGAVVILNAIWIYLCVLGAVIGVGFLIWRIVYTRYRGW